MLANIKDVESWLRINNLEWFEVRTREQDNSLVFVSDSNEPLESRFSKFRDIMQLSTGGRYIISASDKENGSKKGRYREEFANLGTTQIGQSSALGAVPEGYISRSEFDALWREKETQWEMKRLKEELDEIKQENKTLKEPKEEFFRQVTPFVAPMIQGFIGKAFPQVAGSFPAQIEMQDIQEKNTNQMNTEENTEMDVSDEENNRLISALEKWRSADAQWLECIEKVAELAYSKDTMYAMAKSMLLK